MTRLLNATFATTLALSVVPAGQAFARHRHQEDARYYTRAQGDIDHLRASVTDIASGPAVTLDYAVKVKNMDVPLTFVVRVTQSGATLTDAGGRAVIVNVPMTQAVRIKKDKSEFRGQLVIPLAGVSCDLDRLRVESAVVVPGTGRELDTKNVSVKSH